MTGTPLTSLRKAIHYFSFPGVVNKIKISVRTDSLKVQGDLFSHFRDRALNQMQQFSVNIFNLLDSMTLLVFRLKFILCQILLVYFNKDHLDCNSLASIIARISFNSHAKLWYHFHIYVLLCGFLHDMPQMRGVYI